MSQNRRMIAVSRRAVKDRRAASFSSAFMWSTDTTGTGSSGTVGGFRFDSGEYSTSPSVTIHGKNCRGEVRGDGLHALAVRPQGEPPRA